MSVLSNERFHYIDVAKGLLIIMVVYSHIEWLLSTRLGMFSVEWSFLNRIGFYLWVPFYMECFFVITGFCTSFKKDFSSFIQGKIVSLIFPMFALMFGIHWFICAMFNALLIFFYCKKKVSNTLFLYVLMFFFSVFGSLCASYDQLISIKRYYIFHSIGLVGFICLGQVFKKYQEFILVPKVVVSCIIMYLTIVIIGFINHLYLPAIYSKYDVHITQWPLHILLSVTGSISIMGISKYIGKNRYLEYLGRNSLVIFLVHFSIIPIVARAFCNYIDTYWAFFCVLIITLILSSVVSYILSFSQLSWMIGKFKRTF